MKKSSIFLLSALGFMMAACDAELPVAEPQKNDPQTPFNSSDIVINKLGVLASSSVVNLNDYTDAEELVPVFEVVEENNVPAGAALDFTLEFAADEDFSFVYSLTPEAGTGDNENKYYVTPEQLNNAHVGVVGGQMVEKTLYYRIAIAVVSNGTNYVLDNPISGSLKEICIAGSAFEYLTVPYRITSANIGNISQADWDSYLRLTTTDYVTYTGTMRLYQGWFLTSLPELEGFNFMQAPETSATTDEETFVTTGELVKLPSYLDGTTMTAPTNGLYYINVDIVKLTYSLSQIKAISLIGGFNEWNLETAIDLKQGSGSRIGNFTLSNVTFEEDGEYKFCVNHAWTLSYGGEADNIQQNGGNLSIKAGTYDFELDFGVQPNKLIITKK